MTNFQKDFVGIFDTDNNGRIEYYELYPLFLLFAMLILFFILISNLEILIIFKQTKLFVVFFLLLIAYSVLGIIDYNKKYDERHKPSVEANFYYIINVLNALICTFCLIYLSGVLFL
jgi:glucan phosphoethanolaminetransferase (alkaline phosphatase superfamily)